MPTRAALITEDGVRVFGAAYEVPPDENALDLDATSAPWVLLLHMMPETKESWEAFAQALVGLGVNALAIDLRGHGESVGSQFGALNYRTFTDAEHQESTRDVEAAAKWIMDRHGVKRSHVAVCGASIGANLALAYAAANQSCPAVLALSPGLDFRGISAEDKVLALAASQQKIIVASDDDAESFDASRELAAIKRSMTLKELHGAGHGTRMFDAEPGLVRELAVWLKKSFH